MYQYPYGNAQQLNLDWILSKIQELEAGSTEVNIEEVANALIAASFDAGVSYRRYDYCFYNGKLYRALNDNTGTFNPSDWLEVVIGDDIPVLTRLLNAVDTSLTSLQNTVNDLDSDDVDNASNVTGTTVTDALDNLNGAINNTNLQVTPYIETGTKATRGYSAGHFLIWNNLLYIVASQISLGDTFTAGTNILQTYIVGRFLPAQYYPGEYIMFNGAELGLSAANNLVNVNIRTERQIPSNITITPHLIVGWIRYNGTTDGNVEFVSASRSTANSFIITVRATNGISSGNVCGVFLQGDIALS